MLSWLSLVSLAVKVWSYLTHRAAVKEGASEQGTKDQNAVITETQDAKKISDNTSGLSDDELRKRLLSNSPDRPDPE